MSHYRTAYQLGFGDVGASDDAPAPEYLATVTVDITGTGDDLPTVEQVLAAVQECIELGAVSAKLIELPEDSAE